MPNLKEPYVASADQVRITRSGDDAIIEYADDSVSTTHLKVGADRLAAMSDDELLDFWNDHLVARQEHRDSLSYTATEIPVGKPQLELAHGRQWVPRGHVVRCDILSDAAIEPALEEPFVSVDSQDLTLAEFMTMVGTFGGWGMRIEFVPRDELHVRPRVRVREPDPKKGLRSFRRKPGRGSY